MTQKSTGKPNSFDIGDRVIASSKYGSKVGILKYLGETRFAHGMWCGIQLDEATGINDGSVEGEQYFVCPSNHGIFVPISKVSLSPNSKKPRIRKSASFESIHSGNTATIAAPNCTPKGTLDAQGKIECLEYLLEQEKKKSADLQYRMDEACMSAGDYNDELSKYREKVEKLEKELKFKNKVLIDNKLLAAGDFISNKNQDCESIETMCLKMQLDEIMKKCRVQDDLRKCLEMKLKEAEENLELRENSTKVSEEVLRDEITFSTKRLGELENELDGKEKMIEDLKRSLKRDGEKKSEEIEAMKINIQLLEDQLKAKESQLNELMRSLENAQKETERKSQQIVQLERESAEIARRSLAESDEAIEQQKAEKKALEMDLLKTDKALKDLKMTIKKLEDSLEEKRLELEARAQEIAKLLAKIEQLEKENSEKDQRLDEFVKNQEKIEADMAKWQDELDQVREKNSTLQIDMEIVRSSTVDASELTRLSQLVDEKESSLQAQIEDFEKLTQENTVMKLNLETCEEELARLRSQGIEQEQQLKVELDTFKRNSVLQTDSLKREMDALRETLESERLKFSQQIAETEAKKKELEDTIASLETQIAVLKQEVDESRDKAEKDKQKMCREVLEMRIRNEEFSKDLDGYIKSEKCLKGQLESLNESYQKMKNENKALMDETECIKQKLDELENARADLEEFREDEREKCEMMKETISVLESRIRCLIDQEKCLRECLAERERKIQKMECLAAQNDEYMEKLLTEKKSESFKFREDMEIKGKIIEDLNEKLADLELCLYETDTKADPKYVELQESLSEKELKIQHFQELIKNWEVKCKKQEKVFQKEIQLTKSASSGKIHQLEEKIECFESKRNDELRKLKEKLLQVEATIDSFSGEAKSCAERLKEKCKRETELIEYIKELECRETELTTLNEHLQKQMEDLLESGHIVRPDTSESDEHIDFLNSMVTNLHADKLRLLNRVEALESESSHSPYTSATSTIDTQLFCDHCGGFENHETGDCPHFCSDTSQADSPTDEY
jgi:CAP-Gly domain-containing linker protein 1